MQTLVVRDQDFRKDMSRGGYMDVTDKLPELEKREQDTVGARPYLTVSVRMYMYMHVCMYVCVYTKLAELEKREHDTVGARPYLTVSVRMYMYMHM
jgi:hypothetical protein